MGEAETRGVEAEVRAERYEGLRLMADCACRDSGVCERGGCARYQAVETLRAAAGYRVRCLTACRTRVLTKP